MTAVWEPARQVPVSGEAEVIVCGGGPAGTAAAVAAATAGVSVILLESSGVPGGIMTSGLMPNILDGENKPGFLAQFLQELRAAGAAGNHRCFLPETVKHLLEKYLTAAGVRIRYNTRVCAVPVSGRNVTAVITESPSGREAFCGRFFLDCTGDGTAAALAGCRYQFGCPESGLPQAATLCALGSGVPAAEISAYLDETGGRGKRHFREQLEKAGVPPSYRQPTLFHLPGDHYLLMSNHENDVRPDDADGISAALIRARSEIYRQVEQLRRSDPAMAGLTLLTTAAALGLREGRRIRSRCDLTLADLLEGRSRPDAVCRVTMPVDIHPADGGCTDGGFRTRPYDIPLGSLIAADVDNLLLGGRCIGGDFYAHATYRVLGNAIPVGEAAGIAAAAAVKCGVPLPELAFDDYLRCGGDHRFRY